MASWYDEDDDEEFEEEVVWDVVRERRDVSPKAKKAKDLSTAATSSPSSSSSPSPSSTTSKRFPTSARMIIPRKTSSSSGTAARQSAPVNIPDWSKIYQLKNHPSSAHADDDDESYNNNVGGLQEEDDDDDGSEGEEEEGSKVPPHEWLAKKMARTRISSFSVCEGAGRTLKGRDLSKVRNAVLTRTGFLE